MPITKKDKMILYVPIFLRGLTDMVHFNLVYHFTREILKKGMIRSEIARKASILIWRVLVMF